MILEEYKLLKEKGLKRLEIANHFNVSENQLKGWIKKNGVATPKPTVKNIDAFSSFTEESCYWAGFLAADGCITGGTLKLCLGYDDHSHVEKFKEFIGSSHKIAVNTEKYYRSEISFKQEKVILDLKNNFNITPNKSLTYTLPTKIPKEMFKHFVRGYFDGDGCICESGLISVVPTVVRSAWRRCASLHTRTCVRSTSLTSLARVGTGVSRCSSRYLS